MRICVAALRRDGAAGAFWGKGMPNDVMRSPRPCLIIAIEQNCDSKSCHRKGVAKAYFSCGAKHFKTSFLLIYSVRSVFVPI